MAITNINRDYGNAVEIVRITSTDNLAAIGTTDYVLNQAANIYQINGGPFNWKVSDFVLVYASDGWALYTISPDFKSLTLFSNGESGLFLPPITVGDIPIFHSNTQLSDSGINFAAGTSGSVITTNTAGSAQTIESGGLAVAAGAVTSGEPSGGFAGALVMYPVTASTGQLALQALPNSGNDNILITNAAFGQSSTLTIPDPGAAAATFVLNVGGVVTVPVESGTAAVIIGSAAGGGHPTYKAFSGTTNKGSINLASADNSGNFDNLLSNAPTGQATTWSLPDPGTALTNIILDKSSAKTQSIEGNLTFGATNYVTVTAFVGATFTALASAGKVNIFVAPTGTAQIVILDIKVVLSAGLTGGNRLLALTDGAKVFNDTGITAALLQTPVFTPWGGTGNPFPSAAESTISTSGTNVYLQYTGGTTDYTGGGVDIAVTYAQVLT